MTLFTVRVTIYTMTLCPKAVFKTAGNVVSTPVDTPKLSNFLTPLAEVAVNLQSEYLQTGNMPKL